MMKQFVLLAALVTLVTAPIAGQSGRGGRGASMAAPAAPQLKFHVDEEFFKLPDNIWRRKRSASRSTPRATSSC
jgi:hypothetical protein